MGWSSFMLVAQDLPSVVPLEGRGNGIEEVQERDDRLVREFQRETDDRQVVGFHGYLLGARDFLPVERAATRFAARSLASFRR